MQVSFFYEVFIWWLLFFGLGLCALPLAAILFKSLFDKGYIFAKVIGVTILSYCLFLIGVLHIARFHVLEIWLVLLVFTMISFFSYWKWQHKTYSLQLLIRRHWHIFFIEEVLFFLCLLSWSFIRSYQPDIHGLEKFMDFGFVNSIVRSDYFPPRDMWFTPFSINYYYFGHLQTAVLTKLSGLATPITYNLMLATLFAFTFVGAFSLAYNIVSFFVSRSDDTKKEKDHKLSHRSVVTGLLAGFLTACAGNLQMIYAFFAPYGENPKPFWDLAFLPQTFPNAYWYPNATRFIPFTIHEFPIYSFVVSDLHGHVLDIPIVLTILALLLSYFVQFRHKLIPLFSLIPISFLLAVAYMTNAWDGMIYFLLAVAIIGVLQTLRSGVFTFSKELLLSIATPVVVLLFGYILFTLPYSYFFKPFVSGIGVLCAPEFLTKLGHIGPLLFEAQHCQHSPWWQLLILHGFWYFWVLSFIIFLFRKTNHKSEIRNQKQFQSHFDDAYLFRILRFEFRVLPIDLFVLLLILLATVLLIIPELIYAKDIYPAHYRANTMFKLGYQAFMMLGISTAYIIVRLLMYTRSQGFHFKRFPLQMAYWLIGCIGLLLVGIYPYFAITSYYGNLTTFKGLDGITYLKTLYPGDYDAITWINSHIKGQPVILEGQGDSYTDYARISANTGLPTVLGWTVHEWLWRGTYDIPSPRIAEVSTMYTDPTSKAGRDLLRKYHVEYIIVGTLERQKYPTIDEAKLAEVGKVVHKNSQTTIFKINL